MAEPLRLFFLAFYAIGVTMLILRVLPLAVRSAPAERRAEGGASTCPSSSCRSGS
jgi:hypothetical protein